MSKEIFFNSDARKFWLLINFAEIDQENLRSKKIQTGNQV